MILVSVFVNGIEVTISHDGYGLDYWPVSCGGFGLLFMMCRDGPSWCIIKPHNITHDYS
jgi:hypothetical protein